MKENKSLTLKLCQKNQEKLKKLSTRKINKKLNTKEVLHICLKSEDKELRYALVENLENFKEQGTRLQQCIAENGTLTMECLLGQSGPNVVSRPQSPRSIFYLRFHDFIVVIS